MPTLSRARVVVLAAVLGGGAGAGCGRSSGYAPDQACLHVLRAAGVSFREGPPLRGVRTPVTLDGARFTPHLIARGRRAPEMDCQLAAALVGAGPTFKRLGITDLEYSAAYDHRNVRGSHKLSAHAAGLAIDVHVFRVGASKLVVLGGFERRPDRWRALRPGPDARQSCLASPRTATGRTLRDLACTLALDDNFAVIITPDDNDDHRDHLHIEARPDVVGGSLPRTRRVAEL